MTATPDVPEPTADSGKPDALSVRVGDAERSAVLERLALAHTNGELDLHEFDERSEAATKAKVRSDLVPLTADLPLSQPVAASPSNSSASSSPARRSDSAAMIDARQNFRGAITGWAFIAVLTNVIWLLTSLNGDGDDAYYWPVWPMLGVGIGVVATFFQLQQVKNRN